MSQQFQVEDILELLESIPAEIKSCYEEVKILDSSIRSQNEKVDFAMSEYFEILSSRRPSSSEDAAKKKGEIISKVVSTIFDSERKLERLNNCYDAIGRHSMRLSREVLRRKFCLDSDTRGSSDLTIQRIVASENITHEELTEMQHDNPGDFLLEYVKHSIIDTKFGHSNHLPEANVGVGVGAYTPVPMVPPKKLHHATKAGVKKNKTTKPAGLKVNDSLLSAVVPAGGARAGALDRPPLGMPNEPADSCSLPE